MCLSCIRASTSDLEGAVVPSTAREDDDGRPKRVSRHAGALWRCSCGVTLASGVSMMQRSDWVDLITGQMVVWMESSLWEVTAALPQVRRVDVRTMEGSRAPARYEVQHTLGTAAALVDFG